MFDTLYGFYRNQQKARQQAGLNQPFSTGLPEGIPNGNIPTQEEYLRRIGGSANYSNAVPMLPPEIKSITDISVNPYGSFTADALINPPINPDYQPQPEAMAPEAPVELPSKEDVIGTVDSLGQQLRPSDNPSGASIHDEAMKQINSILSSQDPKSAWQEKQDLPIWQRNDAYAGLIGVGLSLLSGASPIEAYQAAEGMRGTQARKDELANNKAYLLDRYTADSVSDALASGDTSRLKEKGMSAKDQFALQQAQGDLDYARRKDFAQFQNDLKGEDPGSWTSGGNGIIFNTRSGAVMNIGGNTAGSDTEAGQLEPIKKDGVWMVPDTNKGVQTGQYRVAKSTEIKALEAPKQAEDETISAFGQLEASERSLDEMFNFPKDTRKASQGVVDSFFPTWQTDVKDYEIRRDQVAAQSFLSQRELLKGQGAITDFESKRAEQAYTILTDPNSSVEAQDKEYKYLKQLMGDVRYRLEKKAQEGGFELKPKRDGALSGQSNTNSGWGVKQIN